MSKICKKHQERPARIYGQCIGCEIDDLNQRIREQEDLLKWFRERQGWISVEERLPLLEGRSMIECIVATETGLVTAMVWRANKFAKTDRGKAPRWEWDGKLSPWKVTHWMPLPEHPMAAK